MDNGGPKSPMYHHELVESLKELERASLKMARIINRARNEAASVAEWDEARQAVDKARTRARNAIAKAEGN